MIIEGSIAIKAAIKAKRRKVEKLIIAKDKHDHDTAYIIRMAEEAGIAIERPERAKVDALAKGKTHGGVLGEVGPRTFDDVITKTDTIFYIDGIEDPFNLGYVFRDLLAYGYTSVILGERDLSNQEDTLLKSSAGAYDLIDIYKSKDLYKDIASLKDDYRVVALVRSDKATDIYEYVWPTKTLVIIGGEKRGINKRIAGLIDDEVFIPYFSDFRPALNAASAVVTVITVMRMSGYDKLPH